MLDLEENLRILNSLINKLNSLEEALNIKALKEELSKLNEQISDPNFWDDMENSSKVLAKSKNVERKIKSFEILKSTLENLIDMNKMLLEEFEEELAKDLISQTEGFIKKVEKLELETLFSGKYDINNAIITLHPGAGGTESQDWVQMLYRMYGKWANANEFGFKELDFLEGDEAGIKSVTFLIEGENAYGYMKCEKGVHRLVRISPFDAGGRRHTSFASVEVMPEITEDIVVEINPEDLRVDTYRASRSWGTTY